MSKKLIAVASAAALALSALVGVAPANATGVTVTLTGTGGTSPGTALSAVTQTVPYLNTLAGVSSATIGFANTVDGDKITITTSGKVKITSAETVGGLDVNVTTLGTQSFSGTATTTTFSAFAYTTDEVITQINWSVLRPSTGSTSAGSMFIQGVDAAVAHTLAVIAAPTVLAKGATTEIRVAIKDVFGNPIEVTVAAAEVTGAANTVNLVWDPVNKWHEATITSSTDRTFVLTLDANGTGTADDTLDTTGLPANNMSAVLAVNAAATAAQFTSLTAQVAALTALLAVSRLIENSVTQKKYNTLARKWNAAFPSQAVALKK
jgi:hypothetical protein